MQPADDPHDQAATRRAMRAVFAVFVGMGVGASSWASRIPQVRDELDLTPKALGFAILGVAIGSLVSLPLAGIVVHRLGAERTIRVMSVVCAAGIAVMGLGVQIGLAPVIGGLVLAGFGVIILVYVIGRYLVEGQVVQGFPFIASIISIFSGAQLFALGVI
ncbi:MAG TPA: hypothetical protein PLV13_05220, partial [Ilumatobacteraceae bacterium]|nr:hypothetical protein [Ilumatobacteraceae bacterium]